MARSDEGVKWWIAISVVSLTVVMMEVVVSLWASAPAAASSEPAVPKSLGVLAHKPIATAVADQSYPALAFSPVMHRYLVVWEDTTNGASLSDIRGQFVERNGTVVGGPFVIAGGTTSRHRPRVAYNANTDEFLVVYEYTYSATDIDIYARRVPSNGTMVDSEFYVAASTAKEARPVVTHNTFDHQYLVVWQNWVGDVDFGNNDVSGRRLYENGTFAGDQISIKSGQYNQDRPSAAYITSLNQYLVIWIDRTTTSYPRVQGQDLNNVGGLVGSEMIMTGFGANDNSKLIYAPSENTYSFVFEDKNYGPPDRMFGYVFQQMLGIGGWGMPIDYPSIYDQYKPDIAYNVSARNHAIVWEIEYGPSDHDVYVKFFQKYTSSSCCRQIGPIVVSGLASWEGNPAIASADNTTSLGVWEDTRNTGNGLDIYGAVIVHGVDVYLPIIMR